MKPPIKKKKKLSPFLAKVSGGNARGRPDRKAYKRGGMVSAAKADLDPISATEPHAPAGGKTTQKFADGGEVTDAERAEGMTKLGRGMRYEGAKTGLAKKLGIDLVPYAKEKLETDTASRAVPRKDGGVLSAAQRQSLPKSDFALPGKGTGPKGAGSGSYPIPDRGHAQAALSRVSQFGSPAEKAAVRRKVKAKFGMGEG